MTVRISGGKDELRDVSPGNAAAETLLKHGFQAGYRYERISGASIPHSPSDFLFKCG
jgi:hypothetical protein